MAGSMNEKPEIHTAEKPKPLKPLIIEAINTVKIIIDSSVCLTENKIKNPFYFLLNLSALKVM